MSDYFAERRRIRNEALQVPCRDDELMIGPQVARLSHSSVRAFANVKFGDQGPFVLKVFWDPEPLKYEVFAYHPLQRECQNAALIQMIETAIAQATPESPILVNANPESQYDARMNQRAISEDGRARQQHKFTKASIETKELSQVPRMKKCYGWLNVSGEMLRALPRSLRPPFIRIEKLIRQLSFEQDYVAIVYEYVEEGENDHAVVQKTLEFLWLTGFTFTSSLERNWKSGVLVDLSDIVYPRGFGWQQALYGERCADILLRS
ncbi:hypothetical protein PT974_07962 [Cladobotryum mycophilum]|uniref:Aminoglycoside phosphotransferase domain-containing protein n=1 Tax=Cladobotryum mycophilum TaxID=491253 RepID=A0ABR0SDG8_9HYPO